MQKCLVLFSVILLATASVSATDGPLDKGSYFIEGNIFFQSQSGELWEDFSGDGVTTIGAGNGMVEFNGALDISPAIGFFAAPGFMIGAQVAFRSYSQGDDDIVIVGLGPTVGYYFGANKQRDKIKGVLYPYVRGFLTYGSLDFGGSDDLSVNQYGGKLGILAMLSNAVGADIAVKFQNDSWDFGDSDAISGTTITAGAGISAFIY